MTATLKALIVSNGIEGLDSLYQSNETISYDTVEVGRDFRLDTDGYDVLVVPNGTDQVAMYRVREQVRRFLDGGGTLFCFDGWFTDWVPGNRWLMDNTQKTIDVRYKIKDDPFGLAEHFSAQDLSFSHGISGWWACGYIVPAPKATVALEDTWGRALVVIDQHTTPGLMVLTASGPAADLSYATTDDSKAYKAMADLYGAFIKLAQQKKANA